MGQPEDERELCPSCGATREHSVIKGNVHVLACPDCGQTVTWLAEPTRPAV